MPKRNKKKNRQQIEEDDWDKSGSDSGEMISSKDILNKNKKKKNKKNKNKNKQQNQNQQNENELDLSDNENTQSQSNKKKNKNKKNKNKNKNKQNDENKQTNGQNDDSNEFTKPVQKLSKKEQRRLKKKQKQQKKYEESPEPDWDAPSNSPTPPPQNKKKGKKGKKNKRNKQQQQQHMDLSDDDDGYNNNKNKKKNKKKNKGKNKKKPEKSEEEIRAEKLLALKEERQEALLKLGNDLVGNLEIKYAKFYTDEIKEMWELQMLEFVDFYEENYQDTVEDDELLKKKKQEMRDAWNEEIFEIISQDYEEELAEKQAKKKASDREKKLEALRAQGLNIGTHSHKKKPIDLRAQKKKEEKEKLKALRARLKAIDKEAVEKEKEEEKRKEEIKRKKEEEKLKKIEEQKKKQAEIEAAKNDDWDDSSSDDEQPQEINKKDKRRTNKKQNRSQTVSDSSDDEWGDVSSKNKPKSKPKQQPKQSKKSDLNAFVDSDDEQKKKTKRGGRRRKKKNQQQNNNQKKQEQKNQTNIVRVEPNKKNNKNAPTPPPDPSQEEEKKQNNNNKNKNKNRGKNKKNKNKNKNKNRNKKDNENEHKEKGGKKKILRSPICVVMGHVDHGKTKILDHIRSTKVQDKEAGGITQQIGATFLSIDYIKERTSRLKEQVAKLKYKVPGLLFIDTPGHESFSNLRSRGSSMCDIAVLVVDLMQGFQPQTIESLEMLKERKSPFVVALNKIDMCYGWKKDENAPFLTTYNKQDKATKNDFERRLQQCKMAFSVNGINAELYTKNKRMDRDISLVPTSAITGEGIPDLLYLIVQLTKKYMSNAISFNANKTRASVLEVKSTVGYGKTIDVIVSNGTLRMDDTLVVCGMNGPIVTDIKALLLPHEAQEMRVKGEYKLTNIVSASVGVRIAAIEDLSNAVAGSPLFIVPRKLKPKNKERERRECIEQLKDEVQQSFTELFSSVDKHGKGVFVQASTLGALEALITFLTEQKIPISGISIGTISKKTVMRAAVMLNSQPEFAVILAFNVSVSPDARQLSEEQGVRIFEAEIIYHLQDMFEKYMKKLKEDRKEAAKDVAVFPVEFKIIDSQHIYHNKNPFVFGVQIIRGSLRLNTPIVAQRWNAAKIATPLYLGRITSIRKDEKDIPIAKVGDKVSVRIMGDDEQKNLQVGRNFDINDPLISEITRDAIDALKVNFEEEMKEDNDCVQHLGALKRYFNVI